MFFSKFCFSLVIFLALSLNSFGQKQTHTDSDALKGADMNDPRRPSLQAKEMAKVHKKQQKAYLKQLRRTKREMAKSNRRKQKNIVVKTKTKRAEGGGKSNTSGATKEPETR